MNEKEILLQEIHHRVKNNLQVISSLLNLQAAHIEDERATAELEEARRRIHTIASIHENLYGAENLTVINLQKYLDRLTSDILCSFQRDTASISCELGIDEIELPIDIAMPCGLIVNELVSNALRHALPGTGTGRIRVTLRQEDGEITLAVRDNGIGLPSGLDAGNTGTLGLQLVRTLTKQLKGSISINETKGTEFQVRFPATGTGHESIHACV